MRRFVLATVPVDDAPVDDEIDPADAGDLDLVRADDAGMPEADSTDRLEEALAERRTR